MSKTSRRYALAEAQNWRCAHCGGVMRLGVGHEDSVTIEHVVPLGDGGMRAWGNEVAAHSRCNAARGTKKLDGVSVSIAVELMDLERAKRRQELATAEARRAKAQPVATEPVPLSWWHSAGHQLGALRRLAARFVRRCAASWRAAVSAWQANLPEVDDGAALVDPTADWKVRFGAALEAHKGRRPRHFPREQWQMRFFLTTPEAMSHPGCPDFPQRGAQSRRIGKANDREGQTREPGYDEA